MEVYPGDPRIVCSFDDVLADLRKRQARGEPALDLVSNLSAKLDLEDAALLDTLPRERDEHAEPDEERRPRVRLAHPELA